MEFKKLKRQTLEFNCRSNSLEHALQIIENEGKKTLVELGTLRAIERPGKLFDWELDHSHEGYSTLLLANLSMMGDKKFYSVDISQESINVSKSVLEKFDKNLVGFVEYVNMDQKEFLRDLSEPIDFLYIDAADKPEMLLFCLSKMNENSIILIDDMYDTSVMEACIEVVNKNEELIPVDKIEFYPFNSQENHFQKMLDSKPPKNNFSKHKLGVQQYPAQILLRYSKNKKV